MKRLRWFLGDDRAISATVTHVLALGITAILISGLLLSAGTVLENQREHSAREELQTIGNRISSELTRASAMAANGGDVSIQTRHPARVGGQSYDVSLLTGSDCDTRLFDTEACLSLEVQDGSTSVMVPVRNESGIELRASGAGSFSITAVPNESAPTPPTPPIGRDLRVGVGSDLGGYDAGSIVNATNRKPISGFTFTPGQPTVDSSIHFRNDTKDLDGKIVNYEWELDDGTTKTGVREFNHSYSEPGKYTVTLTVTDEDGETDNVSKVVSVGGLVYNYDANAIGSGDVGFSIENKHDREVEIREVLIDPENDTIDELDAGYGVWEVDVDGDIDRGGYDGDADVFSGGRIFDLDDDSDGEGYAHLPARSDPDSDAPVFLRGFRAGGSTANMDDEHVHVVMRYEAHGRYYTTKFTLFGDGPGNQPPEPDFGVNCNDDRECTFDPSGSDDDDGSIDTYEWDFDDGNTTFESSDTTVTNTFPANGTYDVSLTVTDNDGVSSTLTKSVTVGGGDPIVVWAVNSGGDQYDVDGITYERDTVGDPHPFLNGPNNAYTTGDPIANTSDDDLFQAERYGDFQYEVPVANGEYEVTFKLAEVWWNADGERQFDIELEGGEEISNLDVHAAVGHDHATERTATTTVSDGTLDIEFETDEDNAKSGAIVVRRTDAEAYQEDQGTSEQVVMEAENYMGKVPGNGDDGSGDDMSSDTWNHFTDGDASDSTGLVAQPHNGDNAGDTENGERLDYYVDFANTGPYEVWVRMDCPGGGSDSVHVGLDGEPQSYGDSGLTSNDGDPCWDESGWTWVSDADGDQVTVDVSEPGPHTFNLWMREDGTRIDKIVLKKAGGSDPSGEGPPSETPLG